MPERSVEDAPFSRALTAALVLVWVPLATALQLVHMPGQRPWRALIAEDGKIFLGDALGDPLGSLVKGYNGYYQLACRAIGSVAAILPLPDAAVVFAVGGAGIASVLSVYVYVASGEVLQTRWARALMAALMLFTPAAGFEITGNGLEVHWYFLFAAFWALWSLRETTGRVVADSAVVALATWSTPLAALYLPVAARRAVRAEGRGKWVVLAAYGSGIVAQAVYVLSHGQPQRFDALRWLDIPKLYTERVMGELLVGEQYIKSTWLRIGWAMPLGALAIVAAVCAYGLTTGRQKRVFIVVAVGYSALLTAVSLVTRGTTGAAIGIGNYTAAGSRYFFVPVLFLTAAFIAVADSATGRRWYRALPAIALLGVAAANVAIPAAKGNAPDWRASLKRARAQCESPHQVVNVPIAPVGGDWSVPLECRRLRSDS